MKAFEIFKPGSHTSAGGQALTFGETDLEATVRVYDPAKHEAPIVVGHPKDNHPAYGWVGSMNFADGAIVVDPKDVDPDFSEMVAKGRFKKRSASFYAPGSAAHPLAGTADHGTYYLRHVAFLGAQPPAVKGLREVSFSEDTGTVEFEEDWYTAGTIARLFRALRDRLIEKDGQEVADRVIPAYAVADLEASAKDKARGPVIPAFNEDTSMTTEQIAALQSENTTLKAANADLTQKVTKLTADFAEAQGREAAARKASELTGIKSEIDVLVKAGKVLPREVDHLAQFAQSQDDAALTFDFAEGDKVEKVSARKLFMKQLEARPVVVDFLERAGRDPVAGDPVAEAQSTLRAQVQSGGAVK